MAGKKNNSKQTSTDHSNRRRFPRVNIKNDLENARALVGAEMIWSDDTKSQLFDISYTGAAVARPENHPVKQDEICLVEMRLGDFDAFSIPVKVIWFNDKIIGVHFQEIDHRARMKIDEFLEDKIVGAHMISVSPEYFAEHVDFQYWFHGPNNTNVFLWEPKEGSVTRAMVSFDGQAMIFEDGAFHRAGVEMQWEVQASYSVESLPSESSEDFLVILEKDNPLVERSVEILTQLKGVEAPVEKLLKSILEARG